MNEEIKECPFCGADTAGTTKLADNHPDCNWERDSDGEKRAVESWICFCPSCGIKQSYAHDNESDAIKAWNTRAVIF